jgi:hypothetical protein
MRMFASRSASRVAAPLAAVLVVTLVATSCGGSGGIGGGRRRAARAGASTAGPAVVRSGGDLTPYQGLGAWIDIYDTSWRAPRVAVEAMAARGVKTLYLETSNFNRPSPFVDKAGVEKFVNAAHDFGVQIVAWYLPGFADVALDYRRSKAAIAFTTARGFSFDSFALDIESPEVSDPTARTAALLDLSSRLRTHAGESYVLGAIVPSPRGMVKNPSYWPGFPWASLAETYDLFLPMTYFTWRVSGMVGARDYTAANIELIRTWVGSGQVAIHIIGGIAQEATTNETRGFVHAVREHGLVGASYYTLPGITDGQWAELANIGSNPVQTPALPATLGAAALGAIPGVEETHPHEVVYRFGPRLGARDLHFDVFDAQRGEISIYVNWKLAGRVSAGADGDWTDGRIRPIDDLLLHDSTKNVVAFVAHGASPEWGVRNVSVGPAP